MIKRVFIIVMDSFGVGELPDAKDFHDEGSSTVRSCCKSKFMVCPNLKNLGLFNIDGVDCGEKTAKPLASYARMNEMSKGKDTTIGHWEIGGIISEKPMPTFPNGFPDEIINKFEKLTGRKVLCNKPYSGTEVIKAFGEEHMKTGALIVYTSADSVFQIAAHESVVPIAELYEDCSVARKLLIGKYAVGRVIARPFIGDNKDNFTRTVNRHDFSLVPPKDTVLDVLKNNGYDTVAIGKIVDIFANKGISEFERITGNADGMVKTLKCLYKQFNGLCFVNLVDFDMLYGHRNDVDGYAKAVADFDMELGEFINRMGEEDTLIITADHGCDPGTPSTDHSREYIPMLIYGSSIKQGVNLGTRKTFADIGKTVAEIFGAPNNLDGESFYNLIKI